MLVIRNERITLRPGVATLRLWMEDGYLIGSVRGWHAAGPPLQRKTERLYPAVNVESEQASAFNGRKWTLLLGLETERIAPSELITMFQTMNVIELIVYQHMPAKRYLASIHLLTEVEQPPKPTVLLLLHKWQMDFSVLTQDLIWLPSFLPSKASLWFPHPSTPWQEKPFSMTSE